MHLGWTAMKKMPYLSGMNQQLFPWSSPGFPYLSFNIYLVCIHLVTISQPAPTRFVVPPPPLQSEQKRFDCWELPLALFHFFTSCSLLVCHINKVQHKLTKSTHLKEADLLLLKVVMVLMTYFLFLTQNSLWFVSELRLHLDNTNWQMDFRVSLNSTSYPLLMNLTRGKSSLVQMEWIVCFSIAEEFIIVSLLHQTSFGLDCKSKNDPPSILKVSSGWAPETTGIGAVIPH